MYCGVLVHIRWRRIMKKSEPSKQGQSMTVYSHLCFKIASLGLPWHPRSGPVSVEPLGRKSSDFWPVVKFTSLVKACLCSRRNIQNIQMEIMHTYFDRKLVEICRRSEKIAGFVRSRLLASSKVAIAAHSRLRSMPESSTCKMAELAKIAPLYFSRVS